MSTGPRRILALPFVAIALAALLAACGGPAVPITGTIIDAYTGKPIPSANVKLGRNELMSDASGRYQLENWSLRDTLEVSAQGYESASLPLEGQQQLAKPTPPAVTLDMQIRPNTLSGTLTDDYSGQPLAGALVKVSDTISATTSADGRYTLTGLPESFTVAINAPDHEPVTQNVNKATVLDTALRPNVVSGTITDRYTNAPVANVAVKAGDASATTDENGKYRLENVPAAATLEISADGYADLTQPIEQNTAIDAVLRPNVLQGTLLDASNDQPIPNATVIATPAPGAADVAYTRIDDSTDGRFTLDGLPEQGFVQVLAPGYKKTVIELSPGGVPETIKLEPFVSKALYVTAAVASNSELMQEYFDLIDNSELNTIVIDLKSDLRDDLGVVYYDSQVPLVKELGTSKPYLDIPALLDEAKKRDIYTIARIQLFSHDNALADAKPEWATKDRETGEVYADYPGPGIRYAYLDPTNENVWDYNIALGVEAAELGFDEVNFDYIRFSDWYGDLSGFSKALEFSKPIDPKTDPDGMYNTITGFMEKAHRAVNGSGAYMSVDVFGRVVLGPSLPIAQDITRMSPHTDYISPMPYPSLWWSGYLGFDVPAQHPYEVILESLKSSEPFFEGGYAQLRPWLQDHTDPWQAVVVEYGPEEVRAQIDATYDYDPRVGWMLYNSANVYTDAALKPE